MTPYYDDAASVDTSGALWRTDKCPGCGDPIDADDFIGPSVLIDTDKMMWVHDHCWGVL